MKKLEKDFLLAWILGMVLPALILFTLVGLDNAEKPDTAPAADTGASELAVMPTPIMLPVLSGDGQVTDMELETYICGVVLAEMPVDFELEALKAQSVVSRTYALRRLELGTKHPNSAVCTDPACCQGYLSAEEFTEWGGDQTGISRVSWAVMETAGQVLEYSGKLIDATYFSCSGGMTEDAAAVWGSDVPYLQSTASPGEEDAAYYSDSLMLSREAVETALDVTMQGNPEEWFQVVSYTEGGGVEEVLVCGKEFTGVEIRKLLSLRSTVFTVDAAEGEIIFHTKGYGHRVGMSQYGADAMALRGSTYDEILAHYYCGTNLTQYRTGN